MEMRIAGRILILFNFIVCPVCVTAGQSKAETTPLDRVVERVKSGKSDNFSGLYWVRTDIGLLAIPKEFVLHTAQQKGRLLTAEMERDHESDLYFSRIWIWNKDEDVTDLYDQARTIDDHPIANTLKVLCDKNVQVKSIESVVPDTEIQVSYLFVDIGTQILAASRILEPLITGIFDLYSQMNCGQEVEKLGKHVMYERSNRPAPE